MTKISASSRARQRMIRRPSGGLPMVIDTEIDAHASDHTRPAGSGGRARAAWRRQYEELADQSLETAG